MHSETYIYSLPSLLVAMGTPASRSSSLLRPLGALLLWSDYLGLQSDFPLHSTASDSRLGSFIDSPLRSNASSSLVAGVRARANQFGRNSSA
nr:hypothetical protein Iba_chr07bCG8800 [Ipomoea batatas]